MKVLMVSSFLPYPLYSGGHVRLYNLIKQLSKKHDITLICEKRANQTEQDIKEVEKLAKKVLTVKRRKQWGLGNILKTAASSNSFLTTGHTHKEMKQIIEEELVENKFDLIHVETFYVMQNLPQTLLPIVLAEHNIEYEVYHRFVQQLALVMRPMLMFDIFKIKREEESYWHKATKLVAVSQQDAKVMRAKDLSPVIVANGVDADKFKFKQKPIAKNQEPKKILFIGDFKWLQNRDAAKFIIEEIWPEIKRRSGERHQLQNPDPEQARTKLWIVGRNISESIKSLASGPDIIFDEAGSKRPTEELFQEADILLAPIRIGGGTSYKILESMSCGTPVVTTPLSASAIEAKDSENIMVGKNASELAKKTLKLLCDTALFEKISKNARTLIEEEYTWETIAKELDQVYSSVIASD